MIVTTTPSKKTATKTDQQSKTLEEEDVLMFLAGQGAFAVEKNIDRSDPAYIIPTATLQLLIDGLRTALQRLDKQHLINFYKASWTVVQAQEALGEKDETKH